MQPDEEARFPPVPFIMKRKGCECVLTPIRDSTGTTRSRSEIAARSAFIRVEQQSRVKII